MASINFDKLVAFLKKNDEATQSAAADQFGLTPGQLSMLVFCQAQVAAGVYSKAPATPASVKKLRENEQNRWELIAARTGQSVGQDKKLYEDAGGDTKAYVGRGRDFSNGTSATGTKKKTTTRSSGSKTASTGTGRKKTSSTGTSRKKTGTQRGTAPQRARTRAERAARSTNPS